VSGDASAGAGSESSEVQQEYDQMLDTLDAAIAEARRKVESGRVYDAENEKVRIKWIRALSYAINVRRNVQNDRDLANLAEKVERLEEATGLVEEA
jgi:hypothetical protein